MTFFAFEMGFLRFAFEMTFFAFEMTFFAVEMTFFVFEMTFFVFEIKFLKIIQNENQTIDNDFAGVTADGQLGRRANGDHHG
jgi:hypothetical protein